MVNMRMLAAAALVLAVTAGFAADKNNTRTFERTLNVAAGPSVSVATGSGYIHINPGSDTQIHIIGHVHANNSWFSGDSDSRVEQIANHPPITQSGNNIVIGPERRNGDLYSNIAIDYDISLPRASTLSASTGSGSVQIQDVGASLKAASGSGTVRAEGIHGPADLQTGSGNIYLQQTAGGDVRAQTGSGSIHLNGLSGGLKAGTGSGSIEASGQPTADWKLDTGSGSIQLALGNSARYTLNASTGSGSIRTTQPIAIRGEINKHHVTGTVNGGGPTIRANTGSGSITIN
jgi:hypothetical protein